MNVIKGLILKDFKNIKSYSMTMIFIFILFGISSFLNNDVSTYFPMFITVCFGMMATSSFNYDNIAKSDKYIRTFPIDKKGIVKARYMYIGMLTAVGTMLAIAFAIILQAIKIGTFSDTITIITSSLGALVGVTFLQMIQIPIIYKFGMEKGVIIQMGIIILLVLVFSAVAGFLVGKFDISLENIIYIIEHYGLFIVISTITILYLISYKISCKIYLKNE